MTEINNLRRWLSAMLLQAVLLCGVSGSASAQALRTVTTDDGLKAYYVAGDPTLVTALDLLDRYWTQVRLQGRHLLRGHLDNYLPLALKSLHHEPATAIMRDFANDFFSARDLSSGLIPFSYDSALDETGMQRSGGKQPVALVARAAEFSRWFPEDQVLRGSMLNLADDTMACFEANGGLWGWVDVRSGGEPRIGLTLTRDYGDVALGMAHVSKERRDPTYLRWADRKLDFVWQNRMSTTLPVLSDEFSTHGSRIREEEPSSDTDTLYYVRQLFELHRLTGEQKYRDWALAVTDLWFENAWSDSLGHFVRKLNPDGTAAVDSLYGDGKYNTLYVLVDAYRVTRDTRYIDRLKLAWSRLQQMGRDGLVPERVRRGSMVQERGLDQQQSVFLDILVAAYEATDDPDFLASAQTLADRIREEGESVMRLEGGQAGNALLRLAMATRPIRRLEIDLPQSHETLKVSAAGNRILDVVVPGKIAVVYMPEGEYSLSVGAGSHAKPQKILLNRDARVSIVGGTDGERSALLQPSASVQRTSEAARTHP